jgi:hypothetical protein
MFFGLLDIDGVSLHYAQMNVSSNHLQDWIQIVPTSPKGPILLPLALDESSTCVSAI